MKIVGAGGLPRRDGVASGRALTDHAERAEARRNVRLNHGAGRSAPEARVSRREVRQISVTTRPSLHADLPAVASAPSLADSLADRPHSAGRTDSVPPLRLSGLREIRQPSKVVPIFRAEQFRRRPIGSLLFSWPPGKSQRDKSAVGC